MVRAERTSRVVATASGNHKSESQPPKPVDDVRIDQWVTKIFSIIDDGPTGGFVRYAISPRNTLYVERTGNRSDLEGVVNDLLPQDACRFLAYKVRYQRGTSEKARVIWLVWIPQSAPKHESARYLQGLATTLIGLNCPSNIPILEGKSAGDLEAKKVMAQL